MEKQFHVADVVWARARKPKSEIFWPAQVVETEKTPKRSKKKVIASVKFLGEDTYEDVKDAKDIVKWDCNEHLIQKGRDSLKKGKSQKKICFNKGVLEARKLFAGSGGTEIDHTTIDEATTSTKGNNCSDIRFVDDSTTVPMVKEQIRKTATDKSDRNEKKKDSKTSGGRQDIKTGACKRFNANDEKEVKVNVKCFENITTCRNLIRRSSPRKQSLKSITSTKDISDEKETSTSTLFIVNTRNDEMKNDIKTKNSPALNRKRKREEKVKESGFEYKDEKLLNDCPVKVAKKERKGDTKQKENTDDQKNNKSVQKRPNPNPGTDNDSCRMEEETSREELESDSCSDDELMETALSPNSHNFKFEFNDVVWAKLFRDPFWPAQVKRIVSNKPKKIYVQFLGYDNKSCFSCRRLFPFACDSGKREEFMKEAEVLDPQRFKVAFTMAEDLVRRKALGIKDQNEDEEEGCDLVDTDEVKDNDNDDKKGTSSVADDQPKKETARRSNRSVKRPSKYKDILTYIREAKPFLKEIFEEKRACERHQIFRKGSAKDKNSLKRRSGFGPVADSELENDIMELLQGYYRELVGNKEDFSEITYISDVWLPEAIIYALQKIEKVDRKAAESLFQRGSRQETQIHRFTQQLKAKTLTQEEKEESLQRAQKCFSASAS